MDGFDPEAELALFAEMQRRLAFLPMKQASRNAGLRKTIFRRLISLVLTDDERGEYFGLPEGTRIREGAKIISPEKLKIGEHCWIGEGAMLDASGGLTIGSHTSIGLSAMIWSHSSHIANLCMENYPGSPLIERKPTSIGEGCFIGGLTFIMPGVHIGDRVLVRPLTVVDRDVPSRSIVDSNGIREGVFSDRHIELLKRTQLDRAAKPQP